MLNSILSEFLSSDEKISSKNDKAGGGVHR